MLTLALKCGHSLIKVSLREQPHVNLQEYVLAKLVCFGEQSNDVFHHSHLVQEEALIQFMLLYDFQNSAYFLYLNVSAQELIKLLTDIPFVNVRYRLSCRLRLPQDLTMHLLRFCNACRKGLPHYII